MLKGRINKKYQSAHELFYAENLLTLSKKYLNEKAWSLTTIYFLIEIGIGIWKKICDQLHRKNEEGNKLKLRGRAIHALETCFKDRGKLRDKFAYLVEGVIKKLKERSTPYLHKWVNTFRAVSTLTQTSKEKS